MLERENRGVWGCPAIRGIKRGELELSVGEVLAFGVIQSLGSCVMLKCGLNMDWVI